VKPANVLIGEGPRVEGLVKITDFGISHASGDVTLTQTGQITGTPAFLSPEVAQGQEPAPASDVFSLGATLYTCLEGTPPFGMQGNSLQQLHRVASGEIDPPQRCGALTRPLLRMLSADPAARPTMPEVRDELAGLVARDGDTTTVLMARTNLRSPLPPLPPEGVGAAKAAGPVQTNRTLEQIVGSPGAIRRLSVGVAFSGPVSEEARTRLAALISASIGVDAKRGDVLSVLSMPEATTNHAATAIAPPAGPQPASAPAQKPQAAGVAAAPAPAWWPWAIGTGAIVATILLALLWRGLRKRQPLTEAQRRALATRLALLLEQQEDAHARR